MKSLLCLAACTLLIAAAALPARGQNLPYATSFLGNTWGNGATGSGGKWMQDNIDGLWVKPDGTCYTNSFWDEGGNNGGIYRNGDLVGRLAFSHDNFDGGAAITGDTSYVYAANWMNIMRFTFDGALSTQVSTSSTTASDKSKSIKGLAVDNTNNLLFVSQDLDSQLQVWNKSALTKTRAWSVARPGACAASGDGTVWVAQVADASNPGKVIRYDSNGNLLAQQITGAAGFDPQALCFDNSGRLVVADNGPDQNLKIYTVGATPALAATVGAQKGIFSGTPGAPGPLKFSGLTGVGVDSAGNDYVAQNNVGRAAYWNGGGSILESYTAGGVRNWQLLGLEFVDSACADPGSENGNALDVYTKYNHYALDLSKTQPGTEPTWKGHTLNQFKYPLDQRYAHANDTFDYTGGTFVRTVGGKKILYVLDMQARRLLWYRFNAATDGEVAIPAGLLEQNAFYTVTYPGSPASGEFIWRDTNGNGQMEAGEYASGPGTPNAAYGWWVDSAGDIWQCNNYSAGVGLRHWKMQGLDGNGAPIYSYAAGQYETFDRPAATYGDLKRVIYLRGADTMLLSSWNTSADRDAGNRIGRFDHWSTGNRTATWDITIPTATAITAAGDYVFVGYGALGSNTDSGEIEVYRLVDGVLVGRIHAGPEVINLSGALDIPYGLSAYQRANGEYLVFEEDDFHAKVLMFRWQSPVLNTDPLDDWTRLGTGGSHTTGWTFDGSNAAAYFDGDTSRATRTSDTVQSVVYKYPGITGFTASVYTGINHADPATLGATKFYTSPDGSTWTQASVTAPLQGSNNGTWKLYNYVPAGALPGGVNYLRIDFGPGTGASYDPQLAQVTLAGGSPPAAIINDTSASVAYAGSSWAYGPNRGVGDYQNDVHYASANGDYFSWTFNGTAVSYIAETNTDEGNVSVYLDNVLQGTFNCYSASRRAQQVIYGGVGLSAGSHTLKAVKSSGSFLVLDALATPQVVNDSAPGFTVAGDTWGYSSGRGAGDYQNDVHYLSVNGSSVSYTFIGTGVEFLTETNTDEGNVDIYLDNVFQQTVNCASASRVAQVAAFTKLGLAPGSHTFKAVKSSGSFLVLDALILYP